MKTKRVRAVARVGLAVLALVSPAILRAQGGVAGVAPTSQGATAADVMAAASVAIPALKADSALASAQLVEREKYIRYLKDKIAAISAQIKEQQAEVEKVRAQLAQMKELMASLEIKVKNLLADIYKLRTEQAEEEQRLRNAENEKEKLVELKKDATSSLRLMRIVAVDRAAALKLLDAMKQRNAFSLGTLLDPGASPASIVSVEILSPAAIKMIFKVGALTQCVATRPSCGTTTYAIVK